MGILGAPWSPCVYGGVLALLVFPSCPQDSGYEGVPTTGHAAEFGGGIVCVTHGEFTGLHKSVSHFIMVMEVIPFVQCYICCP